MDASSYKDYEEEVDWLYRCSWNLAIQVSSQSKQDKKEETEETLPDYRNIAASNLFECVDKTLNLVPEPTLALLYNKRVW